MKKRVLSLVITAWSSGTNALLHHLARVPPRGVRDRFSREHARELLDATAFVDELDLGQRTRALDALLHHEVMIGERGDLRKVRHAEHLVPRGQRAQPPPHDFR